MRGVVFIKLLALVEKDYELANVDDLIKSSILTSKGSYRTIGDYSPSEMDRLLELPYIKIPQTKDTLLGWFGEYFFDSTKKKSDLLKR